MSDEVMPPLRGDDYEVTSEEMEAAEEHAAEFLGKRLERAENFCRLTNVNPDDVCPGILKDFADRECSDISDILNRLLPVLAERAMSNARLLADNEALKLQVEKYEKALTPSTETKVELMGEFAFSVETTEGFINVEVPWTVIKDIMLTISERATRVSAPSCPLIN